MTRRRALVLAAGLVALVAAATGSLRVSGERRAAALSADQARAAQERAAAAALAPPPEQRGRTRRVCARGVDTLESAIAGLLELPVLDVRGALDPAVLARVSALALAAERRAERARGGPAVPQRMGRRRTGGAGDAAWEPVPTRMACAPLVTR